MHITHSLAFHANLNPRGEAQARYVLTREI